MATLTPKKQEILERQKAILEIARSLFRERGYLGLNMDRVAQEMGVAKGTIYQHYANKEEVILAMAVDTLSRRSKMFERASLFPGRSRERMAAIGSAAELFVKWYPDHFELEKVLSCESIIEKTSGKMQAMKTTAEMRCLTLVAGVVRDAIASGDLQLESATPDQVVFGLWSITYGGYSIMDSEETLRQMGIESGFQLVRDNSNRLLDGYGWKPFSTEQNFDLVFDRVEQEVFGDGPIR